MRIHTFFVPPEDSVHATCAFVDDRAGRFTEYLQSLTLIFNHVCQSASAQMMLSMCSGVSVRWWAVSIRFAVILQIATQLERLVMACTMRRTLEEVSTPNNRFILWESVLHCSLTQKQRELDKQLRIQILQVWLPTSSHGVLWPEVWIRGSEMRRGGGRGCTGGC